MTTRADRCKAWNPRIMGCRCLRSAGHAGQHVGMTYRHRTYWDG